MPLAKMYGLDKEGWHPLRRTSCVLVGDVTRLIGVKEPVSVALSEINLPYLLFLAKCA